MARSASAAITLFSKSVALSAASFSSLRDDGADVDIARDQPPADFEADLADVARLDAAGALSHQFELVWRHDGHPGGAHRRGRRGFLVFLAARQKQAGNAGTEDRT